MGGSKTKILIIDMDKAVLDSCIETLIEGPYLVATVMDSGFGLEIIKEFQPDLVFVDLNTSGVPGHKALEHIREFDPTIVVIATAWATTVSSTVEAIRNGAFEYLPKPFTNDELHTTVAQGVERRKLVKEAASLRREREMLREHFAAIVSHELKAPIGNVLQNLYALEHDLSDQLTNEQADRMGRMKNSLDDLIDLIKSWLNVISDNGDISKIREKFIPISIPDVITKAIESVEAHAVRKDIELASSIEDNVRFVHGDMVTLCEALVNLIGNSIKYSRMGSRIHVKAERQGEAVLIAVMDRGVGISKEDLPYVFGDFYVGKSAPVDERGSGLGLAITRRIIEAHDGSISVESSLGKGSTFTIRLPALKAVPEDPEQAEKVAVTIEQGESK
jgi:signal transduction histidine kinase